MARIKVDDISKGTEELGENEQKEVVGGASFGGRGGRSSLGARMGRGGRPEASSLTGEDLYVGGKDGPPRP